jgi:hypothetical protein
VALRKQSASYCCLEAFDKGDQVRSHSIWLLPQDQMTSRLVHDEAGARNRGGQLSLVLARQEVVAVSPDEMRVGAVIASVSVGASAVMSPVSVSRQTCAGRRSPSRTRSSIYQFGTSWKRGNQVSDFRTQFGSTGSVRRCTSSANAGRPCRLRGAPTRTRRSLG